MKFSGSFGPGPSNLNRTVLSPPFLSRLLGCQPTGIAFADAPGTIEAPQALAHLERHC